MSLLIALLASLSLDLSEGQVAELCPEGGAPGACNEALRQAGVDLSVAERVSPAVVARLDQQCEAGHPQSCVLAGAARDWGHGVPVDKQAAVALYARACELGDGNGCKNLGYLYQHGAGVPVDITEALAQYEAGCALDHVSSCGMVAELHFGGQAPNSSDVVAFSRYGQVCSLGAGMGCYFAGVMKKQGRAPAEDEVAAFTWMVRGCRAAQPYAPACVQAGLISEGDGTERGPVIAREAYVRACELGEADGCSEVGRLVYDGLGGDQDPEMAANIWRRGCAAGHPPSCTYLQATGLEALPVTE
ncbi:MAG: sel1 repeat family protein [Alphaproteobacteria bacterium]|nr:sel1 repeat family protein [Alphaproteobacteria bacterium]